MKAQDHVGEIVSPITQKLKITLQGIKFQNWNLLKNDTMLLYGHFKEILKQGMENIGVVCRLLPSFVPYFASWPFLKGTV